MQYQVYKTETNEVVAWLDTNTSDAVLKKGYSIQSGGVLFCKEDFSDEAHPTVAMDATRYQHLAMRTNDHKHSDRLLNALSMSINTKYEEGKKICEQSIDVGGVFNACLGLSGEVGEFNDMIKKSVFHEKPLDVEHAKKELGDVCWYLAMMCESLGWDLSEIMQMNVDKLMARYPDGFDVAHSNNRQKGDV